MKLRELLKLCGLSEKLRELLYICGLSMKTMALSQSAF